MTESNSLILKTAELERTADEARMVAEGALVGERAVAVLRLLTWLLLGIAFSGAESNLDTPGVVHSALIIGWGLFAVAMLLLLRRAKATPRTALWFPILVTVIDFGCFTGLGLTTHELPRVEVTTCTLAILVAFSVARFRGLHVWLSAAMATLGFCVSSLAQGWFAWRPALVVAASYVCLACVVSWTNRRLRRMFVESRRRENLLRLLPRQVADRIMASGGRPLVPVQREVTILFSDVRDFTRLSEKMDPQQVLALLDGYFARMTAIVKGRDGMVNKFIGDGLLAVWGVPDVEPEHAKKAVQAALDMRRAVAELAEEARAAGNEPLRIGIGIHTGIVAAGMLGGLDQSEYTVIGDAVNLASRVEGLTKRLQTDLLVSEDTLKRCDTAFLATRVGSEEVKGRGEPVVVYTIADREPPPPALTAAQPVRRFPLQGR